MVRGAVWAEVFLLLFGEEVFLGLWVAAFGFGSCAQASHTPGPSQEGRLICCFFSLKMSCLWCIGIPLLRGD